MSSHERFWSKINIRGPDDCWPWRAARTNKGYGLFGFTTKDATTAHRTAWELTNGAIPDGMCVCHHCDSPPCCNPAHLFLGTQADNIQDAARKGRMAGQKLTGADVPIIRLWLRRGYAQGDIAAAFGVGQSAISDVNTGRAWGHVLPGGGG